MKKMLPEPSSPHPSPRGGSPRGEKDVQTILPLKRKPQQVKDHEEKRR